MKISNVLSIGHILSNYITHISLKSNCETEVKNVILDFKIFCYG